MPTLRGYYKKNKTDPIKNSSSEGRKSDNRRKSDSMLPNEVMEKYRNKEASGSIDELTEFIKRLIGENVDLMIREFDVFGRYRAVMIYYFSMVSQSDINEDVLRPLMDKEVSIEKPEDMSLLREEITRQALYFTPIKVSAQLNKIVDSIMKGVTVVAVEGIKEAFLIGSRSVEKRAVEQPPTEQVIQGPREGFIEHLDTNLGLVRYRLQTPNLRVRTMKIGRLTKSEVAFLYIEGIANPDLVKEVEKRLSHIDIDAIMDAGYLEQLIEDNYLSPFPQVMSSEKPDKVVANMLEGRICIMVDGSPFSLLVPAVFSQFYQSTEDYNSRFLQGSFVRIARVIALVFSLVFPSLYVAIISYNPELIPTEFAVAVAGGRAGVPFPAFMEVLVIEISMEVLREATIRLPQQVGGALSIVGVLVIGQAAVSAGFASPITVVVIALTTIGSFATPAYNAAFALRMLRFPLVFLSAMFGLYGLVVGLILIVNHMLSLKSFGIPYLSPASPANFQGWKDLVIRAPLWSLVKRPSFMFAKNRIRSQKSAMQYKKLNVLDPDRKRENKYGQRGKGGS